MSLPHHLDYIFHVIALLNPLHDLFHTFWDERGFDLREYDSELHNIGQSYLAANPSANIVDCISNIGAQLIIARQLQPKNGASSVSQPQINNGFKSAAESGGASAPPAQKSDFEVMFEELEKIED